MPGERRHGTATQEELGVNWKSALCVTSLYDSYIQLQRENEELREAARRLQQENEVLAVKKEAQDKELQLRVPEDAEMKQEMRLLRSEKQRMEETHRHQVQKLEARAATSETAHQQLLSKYQEKFSLDPLEAKRAALAVKTMQNSLHNAVVEKEELGVRYMELKEQFLKFQSDQRQLVHNLHEQLRVFEEHRVRIGQQRVVTALARWSTDKMKRSWHRWVAVANDHRQQEKQHEMVSSMERKANGRIAKIQKSQAAVFAMKLLQGTARRFFLRWRDLMQYNVGMRRKEALFAKERARRSIQRVMVCWREEYRSTKARSIAVRKITRITNYHSRRWGMRKWSTQVFRLALAEKSDKINALDRVALLQSEKILDLERELMAAREETNGMVTRHEEEKAEYAARIEMHRAVELAIRQRLGRFFTKQSDRQLLKDIIRNWQVAAQCLQRIRQRFELVQAKLRMMRLQRCVHDWHCAAHQSHQRREKTQHVLHRMKQIGVLRCFNSWKERVDERKNRKARLLHAMNRIRSQGVARSFNQWALFRAQRVSLRKGFMVLTKYALKQQILSMFTEWKDRATELKIEAQVKQQQLIQQAWDNRLAQAKRELNFLRNCFKEWHELVLYRQKCDIMMRKCAARLKNGVLVRMVYNWREFVEWRKKQRELVRRWVNRCHTGVLKHTWSRWQRQIVLKEHQMMLLQLQEERNAQLRQLNLEFDSYRESQRSLLIQSEEVKYQQELKLHEIEARLREVSTRARRFEYAVQTLCLTRERAALLSRYFKGWCHGSNKSIQTRRNVLSFQSMLTNRHLHMILLKWNQLSRSQKHLSEVFCTIQSCFSSWWKIQCFEAWKATKQRSKAIRIFSTLFARKSETYVYREVFLAWRKLARTNHLLRRTLERIWLTSVHAKMRQQFSHWVAFTKAEEAKEQAEKRKVALAAIRAKVWWKRSMSTMRFCFSDWKDTVVVKRKQRQAERKLCLFQQTRLVKLCFSAWSELVVIQVRDEGRNQRFSWWARKYQHRRQARAMALWKVFVIRHQQHDLQILKLLQHSQAEELLSQKEEIRDMTQAAIDTQRKLADAANVHDASSMRVRYLTECGLVAKYFNALKLKIHIRRYQLQATHICQKNSRRRQLATFFSGWCSYSRRCHALNSIVGGKAKHCRDTLFRMVFRGWQTLAYRQRVVKQKMIKLLRRIQVRQKVKVLAAWRRVIRYELNICAASRQLAPIIRRLKMRQILTWWHQQCLHKRRRSLQEKEKQKRILQFLMGRQEAGLVRTFYSWKEMVQARQVILAEAQQRNSKKCHILLEKSWDCWRAAVQDSKLRRKSFKCLELMMRRYYFRIALSRWRKYRYMTQASTLQARNTILTNQVEESSHKLESAMINTQQLSAKLAELQNKLNETEVNSSAVNVEVTAQELRRSRLISRLQNLSKVMLKRRVSSEVLAAFACWKVRVYELRRKQYAITAVIMIRRRRKRWFAFWLWKVKTLRGRQLDSLKKMLALNQRRTILQKWKVYSRVQVKMRVFLTKRCMLFEISRSLPTSTAFKLWRNKIVGLAALEQVATLQDRLRYEQDSSSTYLRRLALGKWCWMAYHHRLRQMRAFLSRCYAESTRRSAIKHTRDIQEIRSVTDEAIARAKKQNESRVEEQMGALSAAEEQLTTGTSFQALQTIVRRLFQPATVKDLFVSVSSTFAQILHGSAAVLFLFDPSSNELWTQREENQLIQVPASLGISGSTLSSGSTIIIYDVAADPRFHPMVDQFVLNGLRQDDAVSAFMLASSRPAAKATIGMVSSALVSSDGAVYGVLQVAFPLSSLSLMDRRVVVTQAQLYSKTCCFYVEQIVFEMLRNCRDRVRARAPDRFIKLFKQNKNWRKYYAAIERRAVDLDSKLREVLDEREQLIQAKDFLQQQYLQAQDKLEACDRSTKDVNKLVAGWKKKLSKWQLVIDEKDCAIAEKTAELHRLENEFERYRRQQRAKELQGVLNILPDSPQKRTNNEGDEGMDKSRSLSDRGQLSILKADQTKLRSQLVRAEADNLLLVKAISIARNQHGELPRTIQAEVSRVATRVSRRSSTEA